ncbi:MAG: sensor domain-containing diguanylate cyclase [Erysipelotrichaceae bacterium]
MKRFDKSIIVTLMLIALLSVSFLFASYKVNEITIDSCNDTLKDAAAQAGNDLRRYIKNDYEQLNVVGDLLIQHGELDNEIVRKHLGSFNQRGTISKIGILTKDNRLILPDDEYDNLYDFETELAMCPYVSDVKVSEDGSKYIYQAVAIESETEVSAIIYGYVNLKDLSNAMSSNAFDGQLQIYVADGETGDFLVDTWHSALGNAYDEALISRKTKAGYDFNKCKEDLKNNAPGYIAFWSNSADEYMYSYYEPVGLNHWMVQVAVVESVVFARANSIRNVLFTLAVLEAVIFIVYFVYIVSKVKKEKRVQEADLKRTLDMYDVQQLLFNTRKNDELIIKALDKVKDITESRLAFLMRIEDDYISEIFGSNNDNNWQGKLLNRNVAEGFPLLYDELIHGKTIKVSYIDLSSLAGVSDLSMLDEGGVKSFAAVPILNSENVLSGIFGVASVNLDSNYEHTIESLSRIFMMALNNVDYLKKIERMGSFDALTGLKNRNCYEDFISLFKGDTLSCIYMDADGLHDLNNTLGHEAGDEMLIFMADTIKRVFGMSDSYRTGGDEFVIFDYHKSIEELNKDCKLMEDRFEEAGYHSSIGIAVMDNGVSINELVKSAEEAMYKAKSEYYSNDSNNRRVRNMNRKLEDTLLKKKDTDVFLRIISSRFMGVYVVDHESDTVRSIYEPDYFKEILEKYDYHFSASMREYLEEYVSADDHNKIEQYLDYVKLRSCLMKDGIEEVSFCKKNGEELSLKIYPAKEYGCDNGRCSSVWVFEKL